MNKLYHECLEGLEKVDCKVYCVMLIKMLAAITHSIDECVPQKKSEEICNMFRKMIGEREGAIPKS